jgi:purine-binding chemotaxis protein CheW
MDNNTAQESNSYLAFNVGGELFAAHVSKVLNILDKTKITKVPKAPEYMLGVINLRGAVLPVIDARIKFGMPKEEEKSTNCIIVNEILIDNETVKVGALVDAVVEVLEVESEEITPPPSIGSRFKTEFISGVIRKNENFIMILDMDKVFSTEEINVISQNYEQEANKKAESV